MKNKKSVKEKKISNVIQDKARGLDSERKLNKARESRQDVLILSNTKINKKCFIKKWKYFWELNGNEKVLILNAETGEKEWQLPTEWQEFDSDGEMYKIETEKGELVVSEKHKVYTSSDISNLFSYKITNLPLKSSDLISLSNLENAIINDSRSFCGILNQTTENIFSLEKFEESAKWWSFVTSTLCSNTENSANLPLESPFGLDITSNPCCLRNFSNLNFTFSSLKNLVDRDTELDIFITSQEICCILKRCQDILFSDSRVIFENFINTHSTLEHFQNLPEHNSRAFESRCSTTNLSVCNNMFINLYSHCNNIMDKELYKSFYLEKALYIDNFERDFIDDERSESSQTSKTSQARNSSRSVLGLRDINIKKELNILIN